MTRPIIADPDDSINALSQSCDMLHLINETDQYLNHILTAVITLRDVDITALIALDTLSPDDARALTALQEKQSTLLATTYDNLQVVNAAMQRLGTLAYKQGLGSAVARDTHTPDSRE